MTVGTVSKGSSEHEVSSSDPHFATKDVILKDCKKRDEQKEAEVLHTMVENLLSD